jgi:hypothetical protein
MLLLRCSRKYSPDSGRLGMEATLLAVAAEKLSLMDIHSSYLILLLFILVFAACST